MDDSFIQFNIRLPGVNQNAAHSGTSHPFKKFIVVVRGTAPPRSAHTSVSFATKLAVASTTDPHMVSLSPQSWTAPQRIAFNSLFHCANPTRHWQQRGLPPPCLVRPFMTATSISIVRFAHVAKANTLTTQAGSKIATLTGNSEQRTISYQH